jgi:hypothetical protein
VRSGLVFGLALAVRPPPRFIVQHSEAMGSRLRRQNASLPAWIAVCVGDWFTYRSAGPPTSGLSSWELACQAFTTSAPQVSGQLGLSASSRRVPLLTPPSGTQRARCQGMTIWMQTIGTAIVAID